MFPKHKPLRLAKLLKAAKDAPCMICGSEGTTVASHCPDRVYGGGGMGMKVSDHLVAYLCHAHHAAVDGRECPSLSYSDRILMWWHAFGNTVRYWIDTGVLK